jgi:DEAD/DEAH box helicase domain-containing protein
LRQPDAEQHVAPESRVAEQSIDVGALIARMRRLREEREGDRALTRSSRAARPIDGTEATLRFRPGQHVMCVPYGAGVVHDARIVDGREQLSVIFPEIGPIEVDPAVNAVRPVDAPVSGGELDEDG